MSHCYYGCLETGTKNDQPCLDGGEETTAITVQWSRQAHKSWLKRKRKETSASVGDGDQNQSFNILCVMKKRNDKSIFQRSAFLLLL